MAIRKQEKMLVPFEMQVQVRVLLFDKTFTEVLVEYSDYSNVFSAENIASLPENTKINKHIIIFEEDKQPPFSLIYNLG